MEKGTSTTGDALPPPITQPHHFRIIDDNLGAGGAKAKFAANIAAIETLKRVEAAGRPATPAEQDTLSRYVGWGGIPDAFDARKKNWSKESEQLKSILTKEEYVAARASVLNAHYTSPTVVHAIYQCISNMGFRTGRILEPAMGVGNFFGMLPAEMLGSSLYGAELDAITGRIAQLLYPNANIQVRGYEKTHWPDNYFDIAVGNIPFGAFPVIDPKYDHLKFHIHDYFFAKTIDQVRPGGVVAFVTSRYTLDKKDSTVRRYIAKRCSLLGAIRLPNTAFLSNAGTDVTTDIIFLQKRDQMVDCDDPWIQACMGADGMVVNQYYIDHPEMVLGVLKKAMKLYGSEDETLCAPFPDADLGQLLSEAIEHIHAEIPPYEVSVTPEQIVDASSMEVPSDTRPYSFVFVDDKLFFYDCESLSQVDTSETGARRIKGMIDIRDTVRCLINAQLEGCDDNALHQLQTTLSEQYDRYTEKYGLLNGRGNAMAFSDDSSYPLLCALEVLNDEGQLKRKSDIFTKRTIQQERIVTHVDTAADALAVSIGDLARVDLSYMSTLMGHPGEITPIIEALNGVIFRDPTAGDDPLAGWQTADEYLSGNVRQKLRVAKVWEEREPERYTSNVIALEAAQPPDLDASEISVRLGATWIPPEDYRTFIFELLDTPRYLQQRIRVVYAEVNGTWNITAKHDGQGVKATVTYGTPRVNAYTLIQQSLNLKDVRVFDNVEVDGQVTRVFNAKETTLAQQKQSAIRQAFQDWVWADPERRSRLVTEYNERFNDTRPRTYDGSHIKFTGMNPEITLRKHQRDAVARILYGGNALLAHVVGAGKTWTMVAAAMESKRLGLCNKSLFVVPSHLTEQWGSEFLQLYPAANILVARKKDFETKNRKKFVGRIATGNYDAVIIGHSQFEKIPLSLERQQENIQRQINEIEMSIAIAKQERGSRYTIKQMEYTRKNLEIKLTKLISIKAKDNTLNFEELGVDRLFVDEAHYYKNLFLYTKMNNVAGIGQTEAQKSSDLFMKCQYVDELTAQYPGGPGRGVIFATGTPISNSMTELYTMMRYLQYEMLERKGLTFFDSWAATFGETVAVIELAPEGTGYRLKTRFARFYNLPELVKLWKEVADIQTADMLNLPVPTADYHTEVTPPTDLQKALVLQLGERAEDIRAGNVDPSIDNMLKVTNDGRNLALDLRLANVLFPDDPGSKLNCCVQNIFQIWKQTVEGRSTQMVFCDLSTPKANADQFTVYSDLKDKLIQRGVPESDIFFIHDAHTDAQKATLFSKVRSGQVRILLGSTSKMGAGTNAQTRLIALHHLDVPWRPSDIEQREGRILRQGNQNADVHIYRYVTEGTFDAYSWQLIETKQKFIGQIMTSKSPARTCEDVDSTALSYAEVKALAAGNPKIKEKMDLETEVARLTLLRSSYRAEHYRLQDKLLTEYPAQESALLQKITAFQADLELSKREPIPTADNFSLTVARKTYHAKEEAGEALLAASTSVQNTEPVVVGEYRGFTIRVRIGQQKEYHMDLLGQWPHQTVMSGDAVGNITRLNNLIERISDDLKFLQDQLETLRGQILDAKASLSQPWPMEPEWEEKRERLAALNEELNIDFSGSDACALSAGEADEWTP